MVLKAKGRDLHQACNGPVDDGVAWGSRALISLRRAVRKKGKQRQGVGTDANRDGADLEGRGRKKKEKEKKNKKNAKDKKKKKDKEARNNSSSESDSSGDEEGEGGGTPADGAVPVCEEPALFGACVSMWKVHPGASSVGITDVPPEKGKKEKKEKKEKGKEREGRGVAEAEAATSQLIALLQCVRKIPPELMTLQCKQVREAFLFVYSIEARVTSLYAHTMQITHKMQITHTKCKSALLP